MYIKSFSPAPATVMHIDLNSCFATIEQQANPRFRWLPVAVAAYVTDRGCILAASYEAKRAGVATGMRVAEGKQLCPSLIVLPSDPPKYRYVNTKLTALLGSYTADFTVKSIDELVLQLSNSPALDIRKYNGYSMSLAMRSIGSEIKYRIKKEIGEWLTVSVGIGPNRFLAKTASNLKKPDGLSEITSENIESVLSHLSVTDLSGIKRGFGNRLARFGITNALVMYQASPATLRSAFSSIMGQYWWLWLHGFETEDIHHEKQKTIGHSLALYKPFRPKDIELLQILRQLTDKTGKRLRHGGFQAYGTHIACQYTDFSFWHKGVTNIQSLWENKSIYESGKRLLLTAPDKPVRMLAISLYDIKPGLYTQLSFDEKQDRQIALTKAMDAITDRFGDNSIGPGSTLAVSQRILDRISFGKTVS